MRQIVTPHRAAMRVSHQAENGFIVRDRGDRYFCAGCFRRDARLCLLFAL